MTVIEELRQCELFSAVSDGDLAKVASSALEKEYEAGTIIHQEGDDAVELLVLREGKVAIQMALPTERGQMARRITVDVVTKNEVVGWSAIVEPYVYAFSVVSLQNVKALSISGTKLRALIQNDPKVGYEMLKGLIKVVASRLNEARRVLVSERLLTTKTGIE
ncbi:MAG: cyclic nucleotide-binding domain-containing protein [Chloroflexi bacterium]|nr:cyclic nucleotide-binding domain-containing protein [Chloroflexota bacterium]